MNLSNIKLNYPSARGWMWNYCLYLGPYTSSAGHKYDLGAHCEGENDWSAAIVFGNDPGDYLSGDLGKERHSKKQELYLEVESRLEHLGLLPSKELIVKPLEGKYYGTRLVIRDKFKSYVLKFWIRDGSPPTTRELQTWDPYLTFDDFLKDREMTTLDFKETGVLSRLYDRSDSHYENISTLDGILRLQKYLSLDQVILTDALINRINYEDPKKLIISINKSYYSLTGKVLSIDANLW